MGYLYDLHCHTSEGSRCSVLSAAEMVDFYIRQGYHGFCITDHFTGNTAVPDESTWEERIDRFYAGYDAACIAAEGKGIKVFFGLEYSLLKHDTSSVREILGNDFLLFGLSKEWLKANEDAFNKSTNELFDAVHAAGGTVIHAHAFFHEADWVSHLQLFPHKEDAVEVYNAGCTDKVNALACWYAEAYGKRMTGGSDLHSADGIYLGGVETQKPCDTVEELMAEISAGRTQVIRQYLIR